ncbi:MAG: phenylalanine--tRNA ligase subunit beta [Coriobacteriia bacterium]
MRVSLNWLTEFVDVDIEVEELAERLDMTGTAVEAVERVGAAFDKVVVGQVVSRDKHPNADKLSYCKVDVGGEDLLDIVCGADNFSAGDKVPVALVGAQLPNGMTIEKAKIRGCVSHGMMCSPIELGLGEDASGLMILPQEAPVGVPFAEYAGRQDVVLDLEITPNRPDCLSVAGVAREVGAVLGREASWPHASPDETGAPAADEVEVVIEDPVLCPRYTARVIRGVEVGPSPEWLQERIISAGARPINNIVDATNYVMFEMGQPLHAFDMDTLARAEGKVRVIVRAANDGETLKTLDGQVRRLGADDVVIADVEGPIALAGVMGGEATEVSDATVNVLLESASFDPAHISRTSRSLSLLSEASVRFERGVDPEGCAAAADRAAALIAEIAGGEVAPGVVDEYPVKAQPRRLELRVERMNRFLGTSLKAEETADILRRLGLSVSGDSDVLLVEVPTFRPDLEREVDLYEEVVRLFGMQEVPSTLPAGPSRVGGLTRAQKLRQRVGEAARAAGLNEVTTYAFFDPADLERLRFEMPEGSRLARIINPMSEEQSALRPTIASNLIRAVSYNQRRGVPDVHLYEIGTVFEAREGAKQPVEREVLAGVLAGSWHRPTWNDPAEPLDFFDGKGVVATVMEELHVPHWRVERAALAWLHPGRSAEVVVNGKRIGWLGEALPDVLDAFEAKGPVTLFELEMAPLLEAARDVVEYKPVPRFPSVNLDVALVVPSDVPAEQILVTMRKEGGPLLEDVRLFDVYEGEGVPDGMRSLAFSLTYRAPDRTLTDDEVSRVHDKVVMRTCKRFKANVRA